MKKYNKKIALILALAVVLALAIPALAAQTEINGSYMDAASNEIHVIVTGQVNAFLNPEGYKADVYGNSGDTVVGTLNSSAVVSRPIVGVNLGNGNVAVKASVNSALKGKFKFATSAPKDTAKTINGLVYLEVSQPTSALGFDATYADTAKTAYGKFDGASVVKAMNDWKHKETIDKKATDIVILKKGLVSGKESLVTLTAANNGVPVANSYFLARLDGVLGKGDPSKEGKGWSANDGFDAVITWTFSTAPAASNS